MTRQQRRASVSAGRSSEGIPHRAPTPHDSSGHLPAVNSRSCPGIALQSPSPSSQSPLGHPSLSRYVVLWEGLSAWFSFHAAGHGCAAALSRSLRCQPSVLNSLPDGGSVPPAPPAVSGAGLVLLSLLLLPPSCTLPGFAWIWTFLSGGQGRLPALSWRPVRSSASDGVFHGCASLRGAALQSTHPAPILSSWFPFLLQTELPRWDQGVEEVFKVFLQRNSASKATGFICKLSSHLGFPLTQSVKNQPAVQETLVRSLGQEDPLKKEMATHSSILVWRSPWTEEPGGLQSMGSKRVGHHWATEISLHFTSHSI